MNNKTEFIFNEEFTIIDNEILDDERVTDKARGLYIRIVHHYNNSDCKISQKALQMPLDKEVSIRSSMKNLIETGYIEKGNVMDKSGRFAGIMYRVHAKSIKPKGNK